MPPVRLLAVHPALRPLAASAAVAASLFAIAGAASGSTTPAAARSALQTAPTPTTTPTGAAAAPVASPRVAPRASRARQRDRWVRPAVGPVTSGYGRRWGSFHPGIDIGARYGSPVRAVTGGRILSAGWIGGYGNTVRVSAHGLVFYYPHLSRILRHHGVVGTGAVLGRVGSTGFSTGPHLHVEIRVHGHSINPRPVLRRHGVLL